MLQTWKLLEVVVLLLPQRLALLELAVFPIWQRLVVALLLLRQLLRRLRQLLRRLLLRLCLRRLLRRLLVLALALGQEQVQELLPVVVVQVGASEKPRTNYCLIDLRCLLKLLFYHHQNFLIINF